MAKMDRKKIQAKLKYGTIKTNFNLLFYEIVIIPFKIINTKVIKWYSIY